MSNISAVIFAAGLGTRLRPLTLETPKPLINITKDKRIIDYTLDLIIKSGIRDVYINYSYKKELFEKLKNDYLGKLNINLIEEPEPMGQGYTLLKLAYLKSDFVCFNGDTIYDFDLSDFINGLENTTLLIDTNDFAKERTLILNTSGNLVGVKKSSSNYIYSKNITSELDDSFYSFAGCCFIKSSDLMSINFKDEFTGLFGDDDIFERMFHLGIKIKTKDDIKINKIYSVNNMEELEFVRKELNG